jgi:uncharacterized protein (TIGR02246 family)
MPCLALPDLLSVGNLEAAVACFARDACLVTPDTTVIHGRDQIRPLLVQLIARRTQIEIELSNVLVAGEVAFASERWTIRAEGPERSLHTQRCRPVLVTRRIEDNWKLAVVAPWGWGHGPEA